MEPDSLSFLTLITKFLSHLAFCILHLAFCVLQNTPAEKCTDTNFGSWEGASVIGYVS